MNALRCLVYAPVSKGFILDYSASVADALANEGLHVLLETLENPEWGTAPPRLSRYESDLSGARSALSYHSLPWAWNRFVTALLNGLRRQASAQKHRAEVVHVQLVLPWVDVMLFPLLRRRARVVCTVHDVVPHVAKLPRRADTWLRQRCFRRADGLIFHTQANLRQYRQMMGDQPSQVAVIPLGVTWAGPFTEDDREEARRVLGLPSARPIVLLFGELRPNKGLDVLIEAFSAVLTTTPGSFLLIAGDIHPSMDVGTAVLALSRLPPESYRWDRHWILESNVARYFAASTLIVLPYTSFASQSGVLATCYSYGVPLVASDVGGLGEAVREDRAGLVVPPGNADGLAVALANMLTDEDLRAQCSRNIAAATASKYDWSVVGRRTVAFYEQVLGRRCIRDAGDQSV